MTDDPGVLVFSDDVATRGRLMRVARLNDLEAEAAGGGLEALRWLYQLHPAAVVVALPVAGLGPLDLAQVVRAIAPSVAIVVRGTEQLGSEGLEAVRYLQGGADDYAAAACTDEEVVARVVSVLRRLARDGVAEPVYPLRLRTGELEIDLSQRVVLKRGEYVKLTATEYRLLEALARRLGRVVPHRTLLAEAWGADAVDERHYLRIYASYLRRKLEDDPSRPQYLINEHSQGYRLRQLRIVPAEEWEAEGTDARDEAPNA